jgi:hypothetical protein
MEEITMRYLKNTENGRVLPWTLVLAKKPTMIECDKHGNPKVDQLIVEDGQVLKTLEVKAAENAQLRKENAALKQKVAAYERIHGPLDKQLPEKSLDDVIKEAEVTGDLVTNEPEEKPEAPDYNTMTNAVLKNMIKKRKLSMPDKINKDNLIAVLESADTGE